MKLALAGSRRLPSAVGPLVLARFLAGLPEDTVVLLRRGILTSPGAFEQGVADFCGLINLKVEWRQPDPEIAGRASTYIRDVAMVADADLVIGFVTDDDLAQSNQSGTVHMIEKAWQAERPAFLYDTIWHDGALSVTIIGSLDPGEKWGPRLPGRN